ncbi:V-type proton ATPase catalytic subunit A [Hordeum vulgare]|nr:V-type proton ATPase catalytic subunit A [Hordeum vulgare]
MGEGGGEEKVGGEEEEGLEMEAHLLGPPARTPASSVVARSRQQPLSVELGPGILGNIFYGIQRPLKTIAIRSEDDALWEFKPKKLSVGDVLTGRDLYAVNSYDVEISFMDRLENNLMNHHVALQLVNTAYRKISEAVAYYVELEQQTWPVRTPRPVASKLAADTPLLKGQYSNSEAVVYVGCRERGNEMAEILMNFSQLTMMLPDRREEFVMKRTTLVENASNMPVAAREASIYTGKVYHYSSRDLADAACVAFQPCKLEDALSASLGASANFKIDTCILLEYWTNSLVHVEYSNIYKSDSWRKSWFLGVA